MGPSLYKVTYISIGNAGRTRPQDVNVPEAASHHLRIDLPGGELVGKVVQEDGSPPPWASITARGSGESTYSAYAGSDGAFAMIGLPLGRLQVRAFNDDGEDTQEAEVRDGQQSSLELILKPRPIPRVEVVAFDPSGKPLSGALVFLQVGVSFRPASTDITGTARYRLSSPGSVQAAVYHASFGWAFSKQDTVGTDGPKTLRLQLPGSPGAISVSAPGRTPVAVTSWEGFPLHMVLPLLGVSPITSTGEPLRLRGLPPGLYRVVLGSSTRTVSVDAGKEEEVRF